MRKITLTKCPCCQKSHDFIIDSESVPVVYIKENINIERRIFICPETGNDMVIDIEPNKNIYEIASITLFDTSMIENGKTMIKDAITTTKEFCKSMMSFSIGGIAVYTSLIGIIKSKDSIPMNSKIGAIFLPALLFVLATILFILGYMPYIGKMNIENIQSITSTYKKAVTIRMILIILGVLILLLGLLFMFNIVTNFSAYWQNIPNITAEK
jgi:hypothetical protein